MFERQPPESAWARWVLLGGGLLAALHLLLFLHCLESFSSRDDTWMVAFAQELARGGLFEHLGALVDWELRQFSGGTRINVVLLGFVARFVEPTFGMVKAACALVGGATFMATAWALYRRVPRVTLAWFWLLCLAPPFRSLLVSAQFTGNHQELPVFMMLALGSALRLGDAWDADDWAGIRRWGRCWGLITGLGIYYCQTYWLWVGIQGAFIFVDWKGSPHAKWKDGLLAFVPGLLPGVLLCLLAYFPDHLESIFFPYSGVSDFVDRSGDSGMGQLQRALGMSLAGLPSEGTSWSALSRSFVWIPLAIVLVRRERADVRRVVAHWTVFIVALVLLSAWMQPIPRHLVPIVPGFLLLQAMILGHLSLATGIRARLLPAVLSAVIIVPRAQEIMTLLPGSYSLEAAWNFPAHRLDEMDVMGIRGPHLAAIGPILEDLDALDLTHAERWGFSRGLGELICGAAGVDVEKSLPVHLPAAGIETPSLEVADPGGSLLHSQRYADLTIDPICDEFWAMERSMEVYYYAGLTLAQSTLRTAKVLGTPDLVCDPCEEALDSLGAYLENDGAVQFLEGRLCSGALAASTPVSTSFP